MVCRGLRCAALGLIVAAPASAEPAAKIYVERPGVHGLSFENLTEGTREGTGVQGWSAEPVRSSHLRLSIQSRPTPFWVEDGGDGLFGQGDRLLFLVTEEHYRTLRTEAGSTLLVALLTVAEEARAERNDDPMPESQPLRRARPWRLRRYENDSLRAPLTHSERDAGIDSMWYWTMLSERSSSQLVVELGELADRAPGATLDVTLRFLGWSESPVPDGTFQHQVEVLAGSETLGEGRWDGRRIHVLRIQDLPAEALEPPSNRLVVKIPERRPSSDEGDPIVDIAYLDWVEVRYEASSPLADAESALILEPASEPRWLVDGSDSRARVFAGAGWSATVRDSPSGPGWLLPATTDETELWLVDDGGLRSPLAIEPLTTGAREIPADTDYVMIVAPSLLSGVDPLVQLHRGRGRRVAAVDVTAVYDEFGDGQRSAEALRRFLAYHHARRGALRYVLLVGDADWLQAGDRKPYRDRDQERRNRVPTETFLSLHGPAASDHFLAFDENDETSPRFAVGRLPVVDLAELENVVEKILTHVRSPAPSGTPSVLMLSDQTGPSLARRQRLIEALSDLSLEFVVPSVETEGARDLTVIGALDDRPSLVHFGGHGSRHLWELGDRRVLNDGMFFDLDDIDRLAPAQRLPFVISSSCATAPFDHPSAASLGETMVLRPDRGAIAFVGASALLITPRRFSERLIRGLLAGEAIGDALVAAKQQAGSRSASYLYNLIGDPALPLR